MNNSKLLKILRIINEEEILQLELFLQSPYFHGEKQLDDVHRLWQYIRQHLNASSDNQALTREATYAAVFPGEVVIAKKLEKLMSKLTVMLEQFIVFQQRGDAKSDLLALTSFYGEHNATGLFNQTIKKFRKLQQNETEQNVQSFYQYFSLEENINEYQSLYNNRKTDLNLPTLHQSLDLYYIMNKLQYACQLLANHIFVVPMDYGDSLDTLDAILPVIQKKFSGYPIVQLYHSTFQLLKHYNHPDESYFTQFSALLEEHGENVSPLQLKAFQAVNRSYCLGKYLSGDFYYRQITFVLYQDHLKRGWLYYDDKLLPGTFSNIVIIGLQLGHLDWVYQFIQDHRHRIAGTDTPEIIYNYSLAHYYFHTQEYDLALEYLADTYEDRYYKMAGRRLEVQIHYEQKSVLLLSKIDAYKIYIYRISKKTVSTKQKIRNRNFIDFLKQIIAPKTYCNPKRIETIKSRIHAAKFLAEKEWLLEKLDELYKG